MSDRHDPNPGDFASRYPYAPANIAIAAFHILVALAVVFGLDETLDLALTSDQSVSQESRGLRWWKRCTASNRRRLHHHGNPANEEGGSAESTSLLPQHTQEIEGQGDASRVPRPTKVRFRNMWTFNVISTMVTYFAIQGHIGTFPSLWAIFLTVPAEVSRGQQGPLQFYGGLGMNPRKVGMAMSLQGVIGTLMQIVFYPMLNDRFGAIRVWRASLFIFPIAYFLAPLCANALDQSAAKLDNAASGQALLWATVLFVLFLFVVGRTGVAPATTLLINDCTPHPSVRATIHATGMIVSSLSHSIFPPATLAIFGHGLSIGIAGQGFWLLTGLAGLACLASTLVEEGNSDGGVQFSDDK